MLTNMTAEARRAAKQHLLADLQDGYSVPETRVRASPPGIKRPFIGCDSASRQIQRWP
jgi:hypothetical protein